MSIDNSLTIVGRAGSEPELRWTAGGQAVASFSLATDHRYQNRQTQEWESKTSWVEITVFGKLAENVAESVGKGDAVMVMGRLDEDQWEDKETGAPRRKLKVIADHVGASMRWATVEITRNERDAGSKPSGGRSAAPAHDPNEEPFHLDAFGVELWPGERHRTGLNKWVVS